MLERGDKLWYIDRHTGKIDRIVVQGISKKQFSFISRGRVFKADYETIGKKYFLTRQALLDYQKQRSAFKFMDQEEAAEILEKTETSRSAEESKLSDMIIKCRDCGAEFSFSVAEQMFYREKGFRNPASCKSCREKKKQEQKGSKK